MGATSMTRKEALEKLGLKGNPSDADITKAWRAKALEFHPDKNKRDEKNAAEKFKLVTDAKDFLTKKQEEKDWANKGFQDPEVQKIFEAFKAFFNNPEWAKNFPHPYYLNYTFDLNDEMRSSQGKGQSFCGQCGFEKYFAQDFRTLSGHLTITDVKFPEEWLLDPVLGMLKENQKLKGVTLPDNVSQKVKDAFEVLNPKPESENVKGFNFLNKAIGEALGRHKWKLGGALALALFSIPLGPLSLVLLLPAGGVAGYFAEQRWGGTANETATDKSQQKQLGAKPAQTVPVQDQEALKPKATADDDHRALATTTSTSRNAGRLVLARS